MRRTDLRGARRAVAAKTLRQLFAAVEAKVDPRKLAQASAVLERAFGVALDEIAITDTMDIRRRLAEQLKREGSSAGIVQAHEQFFMGVVRRAALDGIIPPPPEGPWTQQWQAALDGSSHVKGARAPCGHSQPGQPDEATNVAFDPADTKDADYGALLSAFYGKCGSSPTGFEPVFWP